LLVAETSSRNRRERNWAIGPTRRSDHADDIGEAVRRLVGRLIGSRHLGGASDGKTGGNDEGLRSSAAQFGVENGQSAEAGGAVVSDGDSEVDQDLVAVGANGAALGDREAGADGRSGGRDGSVAGGGSGPELKSGIRARGNSEDGDAVLEEGGLLIARDVASRDSGRGTDGKSLGAYF